MSFQQNQFVGTQASQAISGLFLWAALLICIWVYWPGLDGPALFDDGANLHVLASLETNAHYLADVVWSNDAGPLGRPVSMLSFALDALYQDGSIRAYKSTNLALHLINGCLVAWLSFRLAPSLLSRPVSAKWAVLTAALWLLTPVAVSTTLYIVQRMTQLSTLFCLIGMLSYVIGRQRLERGAISAWTFIGFVLPCSGLALFSKENGAVLLPLVLLLEVAAWRCTVTGNPSLTKVIRLLHGGAAVTLVVLVVGYLAVSGSSVLAGYVNRDFTMTERLFTQARIQFDYLSVLLFPSREGLGLYHDDYQISRGLLHPASTILAVLAIVGAASFSLWRLACKRSLLAWTVLFYLTAHGVESTFIPLELYFEHRNYLPAFAIYLGTSLGMEHICRSYSWTEPLIAVVFSAWLLFAVVQTGLQATVWSRGIFINLDALDGHPNSVRLLNNLAIDFAKIGDLDRAYHYLDRAEKNDKISKLGYSLRKLTLNCFANIKPSIAVLADARSHITSIDLTDGMVSEALQVLVERINRDKCPAVSPDPLAEIFAEGLLGRDRILAPPRILGLLAVIEIYRNDTARAQQYLELWQQREPDAVQSWMMTLSIFPRGSSDLERQKALTELARLDMEGKVSREQREDIQLLAPGWR